MGGTRTTAADANSIASQVPGPGQAQASAPDSKSLKVGIRWPGAAFSVGGPPEGLQGEKRDLLAPSRLSGALIPTCAAPSDALLPVIGCKLLRRLPHRVREPLGLREGVPRPKLQQGRGVCLRKVLGVSTLRRRGSQRDGRGGAGAALEKAARHRSVRCAARSLLAAQGAKGSDCSLPLLPASSPSPVGKHSVSQRLSACSWGLRPCSVAACCYEPAACCGPHSPVNMNCDPFTDGLFQVTVFC